jgi:DNA-directed RNA polymerase I subunit RPA49
VPLLLIENAVNLIINTLPFRSPVNLVGQFCMTKEKGERKTCTVSVSPVQNNEIYIKRPLVRISQVKMMSYPIVDDPSFIECEAEFTLSRQREKRKWGHLQLAAQTDRIKYRSLNHGENSGGTRPYKYAVAIMDTASQTAQIYDAELLVCSRIVKNLEQIDTQSNEDTKVHTSKDSTSEFYRSRMLLGESFGTKKTKSILSSLDRNKIDMNQLASQSGFISKNLDDSLNRITVDKDEQSGNTKGAGSSKNQVVNVTQGNDSILPVHNSTTKKVEEIYPLGELIPSVAYHSLEVSSIVAAIRRKSSIELQEAIAPFDLGKTTKDRIEGLLALVSIPSEQQLTHTVRCCIYLNFLMAFRMLNEPKINDDLTNVLYNVNSDMIAVLLGQFTDPIGSANGKQRYKLSAICKDRLIAHILILILTLDNFRTNIAKVSIALQQPAVKTTDYFKAVGCAIDKPTRDEPAKFIAPDTKREIPVKMAVLKAPLTIAQARVFKGRK